MTAPWFACDHPSDASHGLTCAGVAEDAFHTAAQPDALVVTTPELARELLATRASEFTKGPVQQRTFRELLGGSVSMVEGHRHTEARRRLAPIFTRDAAAAARPGIIDAFDRTTAHWTAAPQIDLYQEFTTLNVRTAQAALMARPDMWNSVDHAIARVWAKMNAIAVGDTATSAYRVDSDAALIRATVARAMHDIHPSGGWDVAGRLAMLVRAGDMRLRDAVDQLVALLFAAHETSAGALYWSILMLAQHPHWLHKIKRQVDHLDGRLGADDLARLPLVQGTVLEALRMFPPAGRQFRVARDDTSLGEHPVRAGQAVFVSHRALHTNPTRVRRPWVFDPDRWRNGSAPWLMPFGAGRHVCLGRHYALLELTAVLAMIIYRYEFHAPLPLDWGVKLPIALRPARPVMVSVTSRER